MIWEGSKILKRKDRWRSQHVIAHACVREDTHLFIDIFSAVCTILSRKRLRTCVGELEYCSRTCCKERSLPRSAVVVHMLSKGQLGVSFVCVVLTKNLESLQIRGVTMNEMGDLPPLYVWDVSASHRQKQVKSFYHYLPSLLHSWQCFVMTTGLVFCIQKWKGKNIGCPVLHEAADLWKLPEYRWRSAPKQVLTLNLSMIAFLNRDASLKWAKAVQNWSQRQLYNGLCFEFVLS